MKEQPVLEFDDLLWPVVILILIILFYGDPDIHDYIIIYLDNTVER